MGFLKYFCCIFMLRSHTSTLCNKSIFIKRKKNLYILPQILQNTILKQSRTAKSILLAFQNGFQLEGRLQLKHARFKPQHLSASKKQHY